MKQMFQLLAEVLALPFSELFLERDLLAECIATARCGVPLQQDDGSRLSSQIDQMGIQAAKYINLHTTFLHTSSLQDIVNYVYGAEDIARAEEMFLGQPPAGSVANLYYIGLIKRIAKTFLSTRDGKAVFKYWPGSHEAYPQAMQAPTKTEGFDWSRDILGKHFEIHRIEAWHSLLQCLPESLLISGYAVCLADGANLNEKRDICFQTLLHFKGTVHIADAMLDKVLAQGLAETHLHAGASRSFDLIWEELLADAAHGREVIGRSYQPVFQKEIRQEDSRERAREAVIVRTLLAAGLRTGGFRAKSHLIPAFSKCVDTLVQGGTVSFSSAVRWIGPFLSDVSGSHNDNHLPHILGVPEKVFVTDIGFAERYLLAWSILYISGNPEDIRFAALFIYYLRLKNYFYRCRLQDGKNKGLSYFKRFYAQSTDTGAHSAEQRMVNIIYTAIQDRRILKTELRIAPTAPTGVCLSTVERKIFLALQKQLRLLIRQHIYTVVQMYGASGRNFEESAFRVHWQAACQDLYRGRRGALLQLLQKCGVDTNQVHNHRIGLVYHFIKQGEFHEGHSCFIRSGKGTDLARYGAFSFGRTQFQCQAAVRAITALRALSPEISNLIVGLDAASLELPTEPWVFAPAFRLARELDVVPFCHMADQRGQTKKRTLGITYHVGEDFRHPLSGLRHVSEVIEFYKLHAGDRLGHALVLGIDLEQWFRGHGLITIPRIEWLEDCLWAWEVIAKSPDASELFEYSKFLETEILTCANEIYGTLNGISVQKLCQAYRSKTLGVEGLTHLAAQWFAQYHPYQRMDCWKCPDSARFFPCAESGSQTREFWWSENSLALSYHCAFYKTRMAKAIIREPTEKELALIHVLQRYLRGKIAEKGVVLEENPSSNAIIGEIDGILSHPIFCLRDEEQNAVLTTINTDDPSVFNASVANEHALIYFSLLHHGYTTERALRTIDELRKLGLDSSFLPDPPPFRQLLAEYEGALWSMERNSSI